LAIEVGALALDVGAVGAADAGAFIPIEAHPAQGIHQSFDGTTDGPLLIGVLDAQNKLPAMLAGEHPVIKGSARPADMEIARGAGCKAYANSHMSHQWTVYSE